MLPARPLRFDVEDEEQGLLGDAVAVQLVLLGLGADREELARPAPA